MQPTEETLILDGEGYKLRIAPEAEAIKADLLKHAALVVEVNDPDAAAAAQNQIKKLAAVRNAVEKSRNEVKRPILDIGKHIDATAKTFIAELDSEEKRLKGLVEVYAMEVERERQRAIREAEAKRREQERIEREAKEAAERALREAEEAARKAAEAEWADDEEEAAKAKAEAEAKNKLAEEVASKIDDIVKVVAIVPATPKGVSFDLDFEVENIDALYRFNPAFVNMEAKRSMILAWLKTFNSEADVPDSDACGLRVIRKAKVGTR